MSRARGTLETLWRAACLDPAAPDHLTLTGTGPVLPSSFAVGTAMQASVAASALAAAECWRARGGEAQQVSVDMRAAAIAARSERYLAVDGGPAPELWDRIAGAYRCGDGRWVRLHTNFPHHRDGVLNILGCAYDKAAVTDALQRWTAFDFETACADAGLVVAAMRRFAEWDAHARAEAGGCDCRSRRPGTGCAVSVVSTVLPVTIRRATMRGTCWWKCRPASARCRQSGIRRICR